MGRITGTGLSGRHIGHTTSRGASRHRRRSHHGRRVAALAALAALGVAACGGDDDSASEFAPSTDAPADLAIGGGVAEGPGRDVGDDVPAATESPANPATGGSAPTGLPFDETFGRDLIIEMGLTMSTPNVQATLDRVRELTTFNGGAVFRADVRIGETLEDGSVTGGGTLEIRIPPDQLDRLIDDLNGVARISNVQQDTEDVTEQLIDLEIRIRQARTGIAQIEVLYGQATEFAELVEIEQELARRQVELERLLAAERGVEGRVALSKLTVTITYEPVVEAEVVDDVADGDDEGIADAFRNGWDAFAGAMFAIGFVLAIAAPFLVLGLLVLLVSWLVTRLRVGQRRLPAPTRAPEPANRDDELVGASHED